MECRAYGICLDSQSRGYRGKDRKVSSAAGGNLSRMHKTQETAKESRLNFMYSHLRNRTLEWLRGWIGAHRDWSRKRLARELCVLWDWRNGKGRLKDFAARSFLLKLTERELIELPPVREYKRSGPQTVGWVKADFEHTPEPLCAELEQVRPVQLDWVEAGSDPERLIGLHRIANNSRFLILPHVRVPHLASHLLALVARRINADWQQKY